MQCELKSQLAYIYIAISVTLRNAIKSPVTFLIPRYYYVCTFCIRIVTTAVTKRIWPRALPGGQARVQDGVLTSYMDAAFVLLTPEGSEIWTN